MARSDVAGAVRIPVIAGPTAAGKSALAMALAERVGGVEIISADSRQVYVGMDIGTAKPTPEERGRVPHHLVDVAAPDQLFSAGRFAELAARVLDDVLARGRVPLVVGGSGFYIKALFEGLGAPVVDQEILRALTERGEREGFDVLHQELAAIDPEAAAAHSPHNHIKTLRALVCWHQTGERYSTFLKAPSGGATPYTPAYLCVLPPRELLYERINNRALAMIDGGLIQETERLLAEGYNEASPGLRTVGYAEVIAWLHGRIDRPEMQRLVMQSTRRFAKRQMTWLRKMQGMETQSEPNLEAALRWLATVR